MSYLTRRNPWPWLWGGGLAILVVAGIIMGVVWVKGG
jgi:hypothetical protein